MKIKSGFELRNIAGEIIVIPVGSRNVNFNGIIKLNDTGAFLWSQLQEDKSQEELLEALTNEYDVDMTNAKNDMLAFISKLKDADLLE